MKTIQKHLQDTGIDEIIVMNQFSQNEIDKLERSFKLYGEMIIDECAGNFECTMEESDNSAPSIGLYHEHPVLVRQSVLDVKKLIV